MINARKSSKRTADKVRHLTSQMLLQAEPWVHQGEPPLQKLIVDGLLSFSEPTLFEFGRLNVLVGPNGSGKSNLLECLRILRRAPLDIQSSFRPEGFNDWLNNGLDTEIGSALLQATIVVEESEVILHHKIRFGPMLRSQPQLEETIDNAEEGEADEYPFFLGSYRSQAELGRRGPGTRGNRMLDEKSYNSFQSILSQIRDKENYSQITGLANLYTRIKIYSEWTSGRGNVLRDASPASDTDIQLSEGMNNLPSILNAVEHTSTHENIQMLLSQLKETYRDYITRVIFGRVGLFLSERPYKRHIPASRLSDGTLHFLALATILLQANPPPLICLDEPELGMHPDMIRMLARMIVDASKNTQLIIATHSEHLLSALQEDFDVLFAFDAGLTGSMVRQFSRDDFKEWSNEHTLGELWTSGELGEIGGETVCSNLHRRWCHRKNSR